MGPEWLRGIRMGAQRRLVWLILLWAAWGLSCAFVYRFQAGRLRAAQQSLAPLHQRMEEYGLLIAQVPNPEAKLQEARARLEEMQDQQMGENVVPRTIQRIAQTAAENGIILAAIGPREGPQAAAQLPEGVEKRSLELRMRCGYQALGDFLEQVEKFPTPLTLDALMVRSAAAGSPELIDATLTLGVYGLTPWDGHQATD